MPIVTRSRFAFAVVLAASLVGGISVAQAEMMKFKATLSGTSEAPSVDSKGTGQAALDCDSATKQLKWTVTYSGLSGNATAAHIHGPAAVGSNAPPIIPFASAASPINGSVTLNDAQVASLMAGMLYVNVHTAAHPPGEIRGQIVR